MRPCSRHYGARWNPNSRRACTSVTGRQPTFEQSGDHRPQSAHHRALAAALNRVLQVVHKPPPIGVAVGKSAVGRAPVRMDKFQHDLAFACWKDFKPKPCAFPLLDIPLAYPLDPLCRNELVNAPAKEDRVMVETKDGDSVFVRIASTSLVHQLARPCRVVTASYTASEVAAMVIWCNISGTTQPSGAL